MCQESPAPAEISPFMEPEKEVPVDPPAPIPTPSPPAHKPPRTRPSPRRVLAKASSGPMDADGCERRPPGSAPGRPRSPRAPAVRERRHSDAGMPLPQHQHPWTGTPRTPRHPWAPRHNSSSNRILRHSSAEFISRDYEVVQRLGEGSFGKVDLLRLRSTGEERVCKVVSTVGMRREELEQMREEVRVLRSLDHPNIVKIHEYAEDKDRAQLILILEYISGGSCASLLKSRWRQPLPEPLVARFVRQMLQAVAHSHGKGIVHRDLKPEHMMLTTSSLDSVPDCKIIDYGLAARYGAQSTMWQPRELTRRVGTPAYMAPEVVDREAAYSSKADLWSVGVSALELLTGKRPFVGDDCKRTYERIRSYSNLDALLASTGNPMEWHALSSGARDFLRSLLQADPDKRPAASEALQHHWLGTALTAADAGRVAGAKEQNRSAVVHRRCRSVQPERLHRRAPAPVTDNVEPAAKAEVQAIPFATAMRRASTESPPVHPDKLGSKLHLSMLGSHLLAHLGC
mmetsp:Transcript_131690/g.232843  ORF Transcript_131690/g.232843 Transcript_131690/m.232843 type:complete len:514 (-) Transcript_131690:280-1821(-)